MSDSAHGHITEDDARELLGSVRHFRGEWARFAVSSRDVFDAFREKGASFPQEFNRSYQSFVQRKAELAELIAATVTGIDADVWRPPAATESLHEFEQKLEDLIKVTKELARIIAETRERVVGVLTRIAGLSSTDSEVSAILSRLRDEAQNHITEVMSKPSRLVDRSLDEKVSAFTDLLDLASDAAQRQPGEASSAALSAVACRSKFESVATKFGMAVAIEALRTGLGTISAGRIDVSKGTPSTTSVHAPHVEPAAATSLLSSSAASETNNGLASHQQIQALVDSLQHRPAAPAPVRSPSAVTPVAEVNPVSLSALADAANQLKIKAHNHYPNVMDAAQLDAHPSTVKNRALGLASLAAMLEIVGYIFAERQKNRTFLGRNLPEILLLLAETQNAVRIEAVESGRPSVPEQVAAFNWLKFTCDETHGEGIHIPRYMRLDDRAEPANNPDVARRVLSLKKQIAKLQATERLFHNLRQACHSLAPGSSSSTLGLDLPLWTQVNDCVTQLVRGNVKPSDLKLREPLLPIIDELPEAVVDDTGTILVDGIEVSPEFQQVIHSIYDHLASIPAEEPKDRRESESDIEAVGTVRSILQGKTMVIVGGVRKPHSAQRLKSKFGLKELRWLEATKSDRVSLFRPDLQGAAVVVLITRLIGHKHNDIREMCSEAGIPSVQMPMAAGYSPNSVASEIVRQASNRLAG